MCRQALAPDARPCVWMSAGVLRYRLCPGNLDCARCPLDAALRGREGTPRPETPHARGLPDDRRYGPGHTWVQPAGSAFGLVWRVGIDALAAGALAGAPGPIEVAWWAPVASRLRPGEPLCTLEVATVALTVVTPVGGLVLRANTALSEDASTLVTAPYDDGWLAELRPGDPAALERLATPATARARVTRELCGLLRRGASPAPAPPAATRS